MPITFTKLFASITESTVWMQPDHVRLVWITMLAMADRQGRVMASIPGLAHRARVETEQCRQAIDILMAPDPDSRTKDFEGRRIEEIDGGWRLLNHEKYRALRDEEAIKESKREWASRNRQSKSGSTDSTVERDRPSSAHTEAYTDADTEADTYIPPLAIARAPKGAKREPPTLDEVKDFFLSKGLTGNEYAKFYAHFDGNGWVQGRAKAPIKRWKSTAIGWILRKDEFR